MFLLDTDHLTIVQRRSAAEYPHLMRRMSAFHPADFFVSVVSFHEQSLGWNAYIQKSRTTANVTVGYSRFFELLDTFATMQVLPFDNGAGQKCDELRGQRIRVSTMDLRIAATALARGFTLLSRNRVDFERVPGLVVEDWTHPDD